MEKEFMILNEKSNLVDINNYDLKGEFKYLVEKEALSKSNSKNIEPEHLKYMRKMGFQWEEMSDSGHMRYQPKASLIFDLASEYAWDTVLSLNLPIFKIKGTNMFRTSEKAVKTHAELFGDRLYKLNIEDDEFILRYAACHQQFAAIKHWNISYKNLPFGAYENADSYRLEQRGELLLSFRTRRMNMPDCHIFTKNLEEAKTTTLKIHEKIYHEFENVMGRKLTNLYNITESFFYNNQEYFQKLMEIEKRPVLLKFVPENKYYWGINVEHHIIDNINVPREIATFQIDMGNAERFNITFNNSEGKKEFPLIIHTALLGTIERYLYAVFDTVQKKEIELNQAPELPIWLSPYQVRILTVGKENYDYARSIAEKIRNNYIRCDIDDRNEKIGKKIVNAQKDWVSNYLVIGKKEEESNILPVKKRNDSTIKNMTLDELIHQISAELGNKPRVKPYLPINCSENPGF